MSRLVKSLRGWAASVSLEQWKDTSSILQSLITIGAILLGGFWTYKTYVQQRLNNPRLQITLKISHVPMSDTVNMLVVDETLTNVGSVLLRLRSGGVRVIKVLPLNENTQHNIETHSPIVDSDKGGGWPTLEEHSKLGGDDEIAIEPGESDPIHNEFMVPSSVGVVTVVGYVRNPTITNRDVFWRSINMYDFRERRQLPIKTQTDIESQRNP